MSGDVGRRNRINSPVADGVIGNLAELGSNIASLAELQVQLAVVDVKASVGRAAVPFALLAVGIVILLAALPIALIGGSELLADWLQFTHRGWAYLIVSGIALALTLVLMLLAVPRLTSSFESLVRSKEELARNVAWIKTVLANSGRAPIHRRAGNG